MAKLEGHFEELLTYQRSQTSNAQEAYSSLSAALTLLVEHQNTATTHTEWRQLMSTHHSAEVRSLLLKLDRGLRDSPASPSLERTGRNAAKISQADKVIQTLKVALEAEKRMHAQESARVAKLQTKSKARKDAYNACAVQLQETSKQLAAAQGNSAESADVALMRQQLATATASLEQV